MIITQGEYEYLKNIPKSFILLDEIHLLSNKWEREILSDDKKQKFILNYINGKLRLEKYSVNKRTNNNIVIFRLCINGPYHTNPDGTTIKGSHVHLYSEEFGDRIAYPIDDIGLAESDSKKIILEKIFKMWNINIYPKINESLFS